jgi:hypothetical protein
MSSFLGRWMIGYGAFLVAMGAAGYLSNPEKAATALLSGGTFGALSIAWGVLIRRGHGWASRAALATTGLLTLVFAWRATATWLAVSGGRPEKQTAAMLITAMCAASGATIVVLLQARSRRPIAPKSEPSTR